MGRSTPRIWRMKGGFCLLFLLSVGETPIERSFEGFIYPPSELLNVFDSRNYRRNMKILIVMWILSKAKEENHKFGYHSDDLAFRNDGGYEFWILKRIFYRFQGWGKTISWFRSLLLDLSYLSYYIQIRIFTHTSAEWLCARVCRRTYL